MLIALWNWIGRVPAVRSDSDRIKFSALRTMVFFFGVVNLATALLMITGVVYSETLQIPGMLGVWIVGQVMYISVWIVLGTRYYRLGIPLWSVGLGWNCFRCIVIVGTIDVLYQTEVFFVLALLMFSAFIQKRELYSIGALFYIAGVSGAFSAGFLTPETFTVFTFSSLSVICALELVLRVRRAEARMIELERARALHSSRLSTLGETTAFLMHEVSTPLTMLNGHLELIQRKENVDFHIAKMQTALDRAMDFIGSVKRMVRSIEPNQFEVVQLSEIFKMASDIAEPLLRKKGARLEFDFTDDVEIKCRPAEIAQVLISLLNNSADALVGSTEKWIRVVSRQIGPCIEIEVIDPGSGIDQRLAKKVMEPFFTTKKSGSGIGLSVAQQIAEQHDGRVEIVKFREPTTIRLRFAIDPSFTKNSSPNA